LQIATIKIAIGLCPNNSGYHSFGLWLMVALFFVEPEYSVTGKGAGYPQWEVFFGLNSQFK